MAALSHFLNLDLVLTSRADLTPLITHLDQSIYVLHHQEHEQQFLLVLEINDAGSRHPTACTEQFLTVIEALPEPAKALWDSCTSRTFSYGFEGGRDFPALDVTIPADLLLRIAGLGADVGITVYPCQIGDEDGPERKNARDALP
ncbi:MULTISPECIES: hypothetical protein [unclassified Bradyrhizobium]|uniref:hypothetical protein n=1 Tax=unclassified Bradyrhizobium TaxID=2631580 RepID=UPI0028EBF4FE|nr:MULTISPECIES: hypothetical protein [unclassified Bradyrhizobium]